MSLGNPFHNLLDDFIPSITDELLRNVIFSGDLSQIENFEEIFHPNIINKEENNLEENSNKKTNNENIKNIQKDWKNKDGEYIIKNIKNLNNNIIFLSNHPLKNFYQIVNHFSLYFNIYGTNKIFPLYLNKIIQDKNYSLITTSSKLLLHNKDLTNFSKALVTISKEKENLSKQQILNLSLLVKPWYIINFNKDNEKVLKEVFEKSKSKNKVIMNYIDDNNNINQVEKVLEGNYLNNIISWLNNNNKFLL